MLTVDLRQTVEGLKVRCSTNQCYSNGHPEHLPLRCS